MVWLFWIFSATCFSTSDIRRLSGFVQFSISTVNQSPENVYVKKAELNGKSLDRLWINHDEIINGGRLVFFMGK